jgi:NAD(P)-dependent dehydrogenase (short-subunit alcohol dehydrogenase family)
VEFLQLDLGDLTSSLRAADSLNERGTPIDVLVANAGLAGQRGQTRQGFELAFGTNHMGHFAFVTGVLDLLRAGTDSRLVVVSSDAHYDAKGIDLERVRGRTRTVTGLREYATSKLANVLFAQEVARRVPADELWVGAVHPGVIATDVWRGVPRPVRPALRKVLKMKPPAEGATTSLTCATSDVWADRRGGYFSENEPKDPSPVATPELAAWLWDYSSEWLADS